MGGVVYLFISSKIELTCFDNIQNQNEEEIDCGGVCALSCIEKRAQPLNIEQTKLIKVGDLDYDLLIELSNPNSDFGASRIEYTLEFKGAGGTFKKTGVSFIAPSDTRFIIESPISFSSEINDVNFIIDDIIWTEPKFTKLNSDQLFSVVNTTFDKESGKLSANLLNDSDFSFDIVDINILLFDNSEITSINKTNIMTFLSKETRSFEVSWPSVTFTQEPSIIIIEANTNILRDSNFLKLIRTPEPFQR